MHIIVLGAGVVGTAAAWYLARAGHRVTVVERQAGPALETSCANGGQVSADHAGPWATPETPGKVLQWLGREDAPLLFRLRADAKQWAWGLRFLLECAPFRARRNTRHLLALALYSRAQLGELRRELGLEYDAQTRGILTFFTDEDEFARAAAGNAAMRALGAERQVKDPEACIALEPALRHAADRVAGGIYTPADESGDARKFTVALADAAARAGVEFLYERLVQALEVSGGKVASVVVADATSAGARLAADAYVVALGSYSPLLLRPAGISIPVYPLKGYSITLPLEADDEAPTMSLTDDAHKLVFSRLGDRLRVAGTAELDGYNTDLNEARCAAIVRRTFDLFPGAGRRERAEYWTGLRPATPSNVPCIGRTRYPNLFLDTGHGTLGWTLACGSARALADLIAGVRPEPEFPFLGMPERVRGALVARPSSAS